MPNNLFNLLCKVVSETSAAMGITNVSVCPHQKLSSQSLSQFTVNLFLLELRACPLIQFMQAPLGSWMMLDYMAQNDRVAKVVQSFTLSKTYVMSKALILIMYKKIQHSL
jgi:hypothetical protein